jgi:putative oxidoreductase
MADIDHYDFFQYYCTSTAITMKRLFSIKYTDNAISFAAFVLRICMGGLMIPHGYGKLTSFATKSSSFYDPLHIGHPTSLALVIFAEFFCASFIVLGLFTRLACIVLIISLAVTVFLYHRGDVFGKGEAATLFLGGFIALLFTGPGKLSLDKLIGK